MSARVLRFPVRAMATSCPDCGATTTIDRHALAQVSYVSVRPLRDESPQLHWTPVVLEHCTRCEWTRVRELRALVVGQR